MSERKRRKPRHPVKEPRVTRDSLVRDIGYLTAMELLAKRLNATPEELAVWVFMRTKAEALKRLSFRKKLKQTPLELESDMKELEDLNRMGTKDYGLAAYLHDNELDPPPRFYYNIYSGPERFDYLSPLTGCSFREDDIKTFEPAERYITCKALIERWSTRLHTQTKAYIEARITKSQLASIHPIYGVTQGSFSADANSADAILPPLENGLFALSAVKDIEEEDFGTDRDGTTDSSHATIKDEKQCEVWLQNLMAAGSPSKSKPLYAEEAIQQFKISRRGFARAWGNAVADSGNVAWSLPGRKSKRRIDTPK